MGIESVLMGKYKKQIDIASNIGKELLKHEMAGEKQFILLCDAEIDKALDAEDTESVTRWKELKKSRQRIFNDLLRIKEECGL